MSSTAAAAADGALTKKRPASKVLAVLTQGRKDMWNAHLPGILGFICHPLRDFIFDPSFAIASILLPPIVMAIPYADPVVAWIITIFPLLPMRAIYGVVTPSSEENVDLRRNAKNDILCNAKALQRLPSFQPPSDIVSAFRGAIAFSCSCAADVVGTIMDRKKMNKWFSCMTEFKGYLDVSGVGDELEEAIMKPMWRGRLLDNVKMLNDIQELMYVDRCQMIQNGKHDIESGIKEGQRMMRFATAAYGTEMIRSALDREAHPKELENQKKAIAFHCGIDDEKDIRILYVDDGGSMKVLRHFVAIDRTTKSVVLALRGTLSISGALVDMQAMDCDFCCGKAHKGIAEMADNVWNESGDKIIELFQQDEELKDFAFVITGHSLGAGTACLLNIKCHVDKLLPGRTVKCYGFAPPPTFCVDDNLDSSTTTSIQTAIDNAVCYIHDNDCVPLLSVICIRRLADLMDAVDNKTEHMWAPRRFKIFWEWEKVPQDLVDSVKQVENNGAATTDRKVNGASKLIIPAKVVIWMKKNFAGSFEGFGCDPSAIADLNIFCCQDMICDHLPEMYEDALDALAE